MDTPSTTRPADPDRLEHLEQSEEFRRLRSSFRGFAFPVTAGFILWYLLYVLLSSYAPDLMGTKLFGHVNVALVLGLLQFASTFTIAAWYSRYADRRLDPPATAIREGRTAQAPTEPGRAAR
ncbi:DUF485 domain-containing protein [Kitasatospora sp. NPDC059327]|uniref:DUF485 domain-containing protein n=1 Tax=Kitasatospora sp. NPDC059327 TaxID=3346803 RepID=UPI0036B22631